MKLHIFALAAHGLGISGGDRIFIELARRWGKQFPITIYLTQEGYQMCKRNKLLISGIKYQVLSMKKYSRLGFIVNYFVRIVEGIRLGLSINFSTSYLLHNTYIYSASDFWMDTLPCVILKLRYKKIKWVAGWFQTAPNPLNGYRLGRYKLSAFFYCLSQLPIKPLVSRFADFVFVNNESEKKQFRKLNRKNGVLVFIGAIDLEAIKKYKLKFKNLPKVYDAVFQGRFHPQKGVVELIDIWKKVVRQKPDALLAMIGDGPLMKNVKLKIQSEKLEKNIKLFGYLFDGDKKYRVFAQSKVVVHPAFYDSGGMAAGEAMAFGNPCIGFDLAAYRSYYPKGMIKVSLGNLTAFSNQILKFLKNYAYRQKISNEGMEMLNKNWSWDKRAAETLEFIYGKKEN